MDNLQDMTLNTLKVINDTEMDESTAPLHIFGGSIFDKSMLVRKCLLVKEKLKVNGEIFCNNTLKVNNDIIPLKDTNNIGSLESKWYQLFAIEGHYQKIFCNETISNNVFFKNINYTYKLNYNKENIELKN